MSGSLQCSHGRAQRACVSLRHFRPAAAALQPLQPRPRAALLQERSAAELRAASNEDAAAAASATAALAAAPPGAADARGGLDAVQREQATHEILRAFLAAESISSNGSGRSSNTHAHMQQRRRQQQHHHHAAAAGGLPARGLQGQVVAHLLAGEFEEAFLAGVPTHTLNWAVKVLGEQQQPVLAEQLYHWMRVTGRANQHSFVKLCEACGAARQPWRAFHAWRNTRRMPQGRHLLGSHAGAALVLSYRSTADHAAAEAALLDLEARGVALDRYAFNAAIRVAADAGAADAALRLLGRLRGLAAAERQRQQERQQERGQAPQAQHQQRQQPAEPGEAPSSSGGGSSSSPAGGLGAAAGELRTDCRSYSAALAAVAVAGKWNRVAQVQRWMREDGVHPDAALCTQLLACLAAGGQAQAAQELFDGMVAGRDGLPRPNGTHWNALLLAYAEGKDAAGAAAAYRRLLAAGRRPDAYTLVALARAAYLAEAGLAAVRALRAEAARHRVPMSLQLGTALLACLRHVRPARSEAAAALAALAVPARRQRAAWQQPAGQQQQRRQQRGRGQQGGTPGSSQAAAPPPPDDGGACLAEAASVFAALQDAAAARGGARLDVRAWNALLAVQLAAGDHAGVLQSFGEMEGDAEGPLPDGATFDAVIAACAAAGWRQREAQFRRLRESTRRLGGSHGPRGAGSP